MHSVSAATLADRFDLVARCFRVAKFDESQHPRDERGRFAGGEGGDASTAETPIKGIPVRVHRSLAAQGFTPAGLTSKGQVYDKPGRGSRGWMGYVGTEVITVARPGKGEGDTFTHKRILSYGPKVKQLGVGTRTPETGTILQVTKPLSQLTDHLRAVARAGRLTADAGARRVRAHISGKD